MKTTTYTITTTDGRQHPALAETYTDRSDAEDAVQSVGGGELGPQHLDRFGGENARPQGELRLAHHP